METIEEEIPVSQYDVSSKDVVPLSDGNSSTEILEQNSAGTIG
jgi:hypothetical protein